MYAEAVIKNQNALSLSPNTFLMFKMDKHTFLHLTKSKYIFFLFFFFYKASVKATLITILCNKKILHNTDNVKVSFLLN